MPALHPFSDGLSGYLKFETAARVHALVAKWIKAACTFGKQSAGCFLASQKLLFNFVEAPLSASLPHRPLHPENRSQHQCEARQ